MSRYIEQHILAPRKKEQPPLNCMFGNIYQEGVVIEIGAGTALPSIVCAVKGHRTIATDLKKVLGLTTRCVELNKAIYPDAGLLVVKELLWYSHYAHLGRGNKTQIAEIKTMMPSPDYIICSEVVYELVPIPAMNARVRNSSRISSTLWTP